MKPMVDEALQKSNSPVAKIKWRQNELILATAIAAIIIISDIWNTFRLSDENIYGQYEKVFAEKHVPFNLYRNILFSNIAVALSIFLAYLALNLFTIPRLLFPRKYLSGTRTIVKMNFKGMAKKALKEYAPLFIQLIIIIFLLGCVFDAATYYRHEWQFHYPGFSIFYSPGNPNSQLSLFSGFLAAASLLFIYAIYASIKEMSIYFIERSRQREYNVSVCNKATSFTLQFITVAVFLRAFNIIHETQFFVIYFVAIPACFAMFLSNVYWLFPMKGEKPFFRKEIVVRLLSTSFIYAIPSVILVHEGAFVVILCGWALQLLIVTPITWWYYKTNEDKILQLKVVEKQLVRSKADLQFLRSQINPHFLFNVLNTLYGTALKENAALTAESIQKLGDMMRFMLHENNLDFIQMKRETEYLRNYIALQKLRIQSSPLISIKVNISDQNCDHKIAPMLFIPLVENAFKHGISLKEKSWIKIHLECTEKNILFEVYNSVHAKPENDAVRERSGIGFNNVLERLKLIYRDRFQVSVNQDDQEFFVKLAIEP